MFKIGEFSKMARVSARMLRHYDKCGLLRPAETDRFTGYRMYSAAQIPVIHRIITLRDMGFGVEEIAELLPSFDDPTVMREALIRKSRDIRTAIDAEHAKLEKIAAMSGKLEKERANMIYDVELKDLKAEKVISLRETISSYDKEGVLWEKLGGFMAKNKVACVAGGYSIYHDDEYKDNDVDVEIAVPVQELLKSDGKFVFKVLDAIPQAATIRFSGPYEGYTPAIEKLASWVEQNGYVFDGNVRGFAITSPCDVKSPEDYMTELQVPIRKI